MSEKIEIRQTPEMNLAGLSHVGVIGVENAFENLINWAVSKDLLNDPDAKMGRIFYDSFRDTDANKVRMNIFLLTNRAFEVEGDIQKVSINAGKCIVGSFEITPNEFQKSWQALYIWMNQNGHKRSNENPFEIYHNDYRTHPEQKFIVDLFIPMV